MSTFDAMIDVTKTTIAEATEAANRIADRIINAGNQNVLIAEVRENSEDANIVAFREWLDSVNEAILAKEAEVDKYIVEKGLVDLEPIDVDSETVKYQTTAGQVKAFTAALKAIPGVDETVLSSLPELKRLPGARGGAGGRGGASGPRPRLTALTCDGDDIFENVKDKDNNERRAVTFSTLAKHLSKTTETKVEVKDLQAAAFEAAGTTDLSSLKGKPFSFVFNAGKEGAEVNFVIEVTPKA